MHRHRHLRPLVGVALIHVAHAGAMRAQSIEDVVVVEVRIGDVASETMLARRAAAGAILLPRESVLALAELRPRVPPGDAQRYVPLDSVRALLHERVELDWTSLTVTISDSRTLPVSRRAARDAFDVALHVAAREARTTAPATTRMLLAPTAPSLDYTLSTSGGPQRTLDAALHLATAAGGGVLDVGWSPRSSRRSAGRATSLGWLRPFRRSRIVRQLRIGDRLSAPVVGSLRDAVMLSNAPPVPDAAFGVMQLAGTAMPGTDVQLFANGELAGWTTADAAGAYRVAAPLSRGANHIALTTVDSAGDARALDTRDIVVADAMLPARAVQYMLAAGRCYTERCHRASVAELRVAPFDRLTLAASGAVQQMTDRSVFASELDAWSRLSDAVTVAVRATPHGASSVSLAAGASPSASAAAATLRWQPNDASEKTRGHLSGSSSFDWRPFATPRLSLHTSGVFGTPTRTARARVALDVAGSAFRLEPFVRIRTGEDARGHADVASPGLELGAFGFGIGVPVALHAAMERDTRSASASLVAFSEISIDASAEWRADAAPVLRLSLARRLAAGRYAATATRSDGARPALRHVLEGSLVADLARARVQWATRSGFGALRGRVFVDLDHDGVNDPGEPVVPGAELTVAGMPVESDARGEYVVWGLTPFVSLTVRVESLPAPYLVIPSSVRVEVMPDGVTVLDIPIEAP